MSEGCPGWREPRLASRTGAAHRRRGRPCQDACGWQVFPDRTGRSVQVLVVSDGHGGKRYGRSDVGSRLACGVALREVERALSQADTGRPPPEGMEGGWQHWLARELPERIVAGWLRAVEAHWHAQPGAVEPAPGAGGFSSEPYGATLGLLVLTAHWWGHTGLGDWDLVRVDGSGTGELLSEEPPPEGGGEATYSLCMDRCQRHFASRSALHPLVPGDPPFQLLLSTDGIRKSCGSDGDFLTLAGHLAALARGPQGPEGELEAALDHISREGSGDDVSVVIAGPATADHPGVGQADGPHLLQPLPPEQPLESPQELPRPPLERAVDRRGGGWLGWMGLAMAGAALAAWWWRLGPLAPPAPSPLLSPEQERSIRWQVDQLCGSPAPTATGDPSAQRAALQRAARIRASLQQRRQTFQLLAQASPEMIRQELRRDPLTALIALSRSAPAMLGSTVPVCPELQRELTAQWALPATPTPSAIP